MTDILGNLGHSASDLLSRQNPQMGFLTLAVNPGDATGINCGGYWMMLMGIFTLCHYGMRRQASSKDAIARGIGMLLGGVLLAALMT